MFQQWKAHSLVQTLLAKRPAAPAAGLQLGPPQRLTWPWLPPLIRRGPRLLLPPKPFWFEKGWRQGTDPKQYTGAYTAAGRQWRGLIQQPYPQRYDAYIWHPPLAELQRNTAHGPCFMAKGEAGRYQVHFRTVPTSLDHAILNIEAVLAQACTGSR